MWIHYMPIYAILYKGFFFFFEARNHVFQSGFKFNYIAEDDLEFLIFLFPGLKYYDYRYISPGSIYATIYGTQDFVRSGKTLYQLSSILI